jgi:DNA-binding protein Fis
VFNQVREDGEGSKVDDKYAICLRELGERLLDAVVDACTDGDPDWEAAESD